MSDQGESQSPSIKERIGAVLTPSQEQAAPPETNAQPEGADLPDQEAQSAEGQEAEAQPDPTADWQEVELDGDKIVIPPKFRDAFLKNKDYTQKTQEVAAMRQLVEQRAQAMQVQEAALQQLQPLYAQGHQLETTIQSYQRLDWETLRVNDPVEYASRKADYAALMQQKNELLNHINRGHQALEQHRQHTMAEAAKAAEPVLRKSIPDWGPQKDAQLTQYALQSGATQAELMGLAVRPWAVVLMEKARKYDELQASKAQLPKKVQHLSPVAKPGAKSTVQSEQGASYRKAEEQFKKSGGKDTTALRALIGAKLKQT